MYAIRSTIRQYRRSIGRGGCLANFAVLVLYVGSIPTAAIACAGSDFYHLPNRYGHKKE